MPIKELLATMDGTFAMTVSWLNSIPLDQSVSIFFFSEARILFIYLLLI